MFEDVALRAIHALWERRSSIGLVRQQSIGHLSMYGIILRPDVSVHFCLILLHPTIESLLREVPIVMNVVTITMVTGWKPCQCTDWRMEGNRLHSWQFCGLVS